MKGWILYDKARYEKNRWFAQRLVEEGRRYYDTRLVLVEDLKVGIRSGRHVFFLDGKEIPCPDFAICRTVFPALSQILENAGARVFNNSSVARICNDKRLTYSYVCSPDIKVADTFFYSKEYPADEAGLRSGYPFVVKSAAGHGGSEVFLVNDADEFDGALSGIVTPGYVTQSLCRPYGKDLRVYVLGGRITASILRTSDTFKSNYSLGGKASVYDLGRPEKDLVDRIIGRIPARMDFVGIDLLMTDSGPVFNEIEDVVGTRMLYETTDIDVARLYMTYVACDAL